jgi:hypothetical protein
VEANRLYKTKVSRTLSPFVVFICGWLLIFLLYIPAISAGYVGDYYKDWLQVIRNQSFSDFINRPGSATLYQFTQLITWIYYQLFRANPVAWHILHVTMHALNCALLFIFISRILIDSGTRNAKAISLIIPLLFAVSPYNSEVVVHEPCLHYTFGLALLLLPLIWLQKFYASGRSVFLFSSATLFIPSIFSLEIFYLTPLFYLIISWYYGYKLNGGKGKFIKTFFLCFLPMIILIGIHLIMVRSIVHDVLPHQVDSSVAGLFSGYFIKAGKYIFHIVFLGRYLPDHIKEAGYYYVSLVKSFVAIHLVVFAVIAFCLLRFRSVSTRLTLIGIFSLFGLLCIALVSPREFPSMWWVTLDRYIYFALPFIYLAIALVLFQLPFQKIFIGLFLVFASINVYILIKLNQVWHRSNEIVTNLINKLPDVDNKTVILLNPPEHYKGVLMIGSYQQSAYKLAYNLNHKTQLTNPVYDATSYNMVSDTTGAKVSVENDSVLHVSINEPGSWWWYHYIGTSSYENDQYRLQMFPGAWYELVLKKPKENFSVLYCDGWKWKEVNMNQRGQIN